MSNKHGVLQQWDLHHWQRLSPWSILYFVARGLRNLADPNMVVFLAPLYGVYQWMDNPQTLLLAGLVGLPSVIVMMAVLQYLFFYFCVESNHFKIRQGILFKRHIDVPLHRIQDVMVHKPFYFKPFHLVSATIDTAGSSENEAVLAAVPEAFVRALRGWVFAQDNSLGSSGSDSTPQVAAQSRHDQPESRKPTPKPIFKRAIIDIVMHGIANNKIWILLVAILPFVDRILEHRLRQFIETHADDVITLSQASAFDLFSMIAGLILLVLALLVVLSVLGSVFLYYGFEIHGNGDALSRESGLFSRSQISLKIRRVQYIQIRQNLLDRVSQRFNVVYRQFDNPHQQGVKERSTFLVPSVGRRDLNILIPAVYSDLTFDPLDGELQFSRISKRYIVQSLVTRTLPLSAICSLFVGSFWDTASPLLMAAALVTIGLGLNVLGWYRWGYQLKGDYLLIRTGLIGKIFYLIPRYKLQQLTLNQNFLMAHNGHCHFQFTLGLSGLKIPYIPLDSGIKLADQMLLDVEASQKSWM